MKNRKKFAISLAILQIIIFSLYGIFVRPQVHNNPVNNFVYVYYQDINVMMLMGFGFLMAFIRKYAWSALVFTFFLNSIVVQMYILIAQFWKRIFQGNWQNYQIFIKENTFIAASYNVTSVLIAFGAILGRVGPFELLIMSIVHVIGYTLNQHIIFKVIKMFDAGGGSTIHTFGAYFGLTVSYILGKQILPISKHKQTYISNIFAFIGTFFLWMFFPSINAGFFAQTPYQKTVIITNTILAMTGSNLACYIFTTLINQKFHVHHIQNSTLAGGAMIAASSGILTNSGASLILGAFGGIFACLGMTYGQAKFQRWFGLYDTLGVHHVHGVPGMVGAGISAITLGVYQLDPINDSIQQSYLTFYSKLPDGRSFIGQSGIQVAGSFISFTLSIIFGIIAGLLIKIFYKKSYHNAQEFYDDYYNFQDIHLLEGQVRQRSEHNNTDRDNMLEINLRPNHNSQRNQSH